MSRRGALLSVALLSLLLAASAAAAVGALTQKPGTAGCISDTGTGGLCADGAALDGTDSVAVSADGTSVYVASGAADSVAIFDRDPTTGALTQKVGTAGCISDTGAGGCVDGTAIDNPRAVTVSPDNASVYVASDLSDSVAVFDRNPTTGALTQKAGTAGCISDTGSAGACFDGTALNNPVSVTVSPGGGNVYVAAAADDAVAIFDRNTTTGVLTQKAGTAGCISETGTAGACVDGKALDAPRVVAADTTGVYAASELSDAVAIFDRTPATGVLAQKPGVAGCISETGTAGACADGTALDGMNAVAVSPDGSSVYGASNGSSGLVILDRAGTGAVTQPPGVAGCVTETGTAGTCADGTALVFTAAVAVSPDSASVYAASTTSDAVSVFDRELPPVVIPDTTAPETEITKKPKKRIKTKKKRAKLQVSFSSEAGATFECRLDRKAFKPCTSPFEVKAKSKPRKGKKHTIEIRAADAAGNVEATPAKVASRVIRKD